MEVNLETLKYVEGETKDACPFCSEVTRNICSEEVDDTLQG